MNLQPALDSSSGIPLYRQLGVYLQRLIQAGEFRDGDRLPATRELAGQLGLNRTTVSAAYDFLETEGLVKGAVGRGSFVCAKPLSGNAELDWDDALNPSIAHPSLPPAKGVIDFTSSRPAERLFPLDAFRESCDEVLNGPDVGRLLQLGSPRGYEPLRKYLLERMLSLGIARPSDDILITNGCQQAVDLLRRALIRPGDKVLLEEPVYPGLRNLFEDSGAELVGLPVTDRGIDLNALARSAQGAKVLVVTPSFQNPTGATMDARDRATLLSIAANAGIVVIENDIYSDLAYFTRPAPRLKELNGNVILLGSFSKIAFPGTRVGWVIAPRPVIDRLAEWKQLADLHTDQLSQAFLLRFAESGRLSKHADRVIAAGKEKLRAVDQSCRKHLLTCTWNIPNGGMNIWIDLPGGLDSMALRGLARQAGIDYLPGRYFTISRPLDSGLRLSFAGLEVEDIKRGMAILGELVRSALGSPEDGASRPSVALV